jgi:hypothetical protein
MSFFFEFGQFYKILNESKKPCNIFFFIAKEAADGEAATGPD